MRVFAVSDIHIDYDVNAAWVENLSREDYQDDVLILAGDVSDSLQLLQWCLSTLVRRFKHVLFAPGNHDLWVAREGAEKGSLQKFQEVLRVVESSGASMRKFRTPGLSIVPLLGWYDHSFGIPSEELQSRWTDYHACRWPAGFRDADIAAHFAALNDLSLADSRDKVITFSHFLPRIDVMPDFIPQQHRWLYPVLGTTQLERQLRQVRASVHVYGHSHVNRDIAIDGVRYINNAFGYPGETRIAAKRLINIYDV